MTGRTPRSPADLVTDPGVLGPAPTLEVFGDAAVATVGGVAILPHRGAWLKARERGINALGWFDDAASGPFAQAVVHLQKGRAATEQGLAAAWRRLAAGGRLLLVGGNDLGVKSAVRRLAVELDDPPEILANRARARVACWRRDRGDGPASPAGASIDIILDGDRFAVASAPGVFSADALDPGSALLLAHLGELKSPMRVFDPGCGTGVLGIAALRRWPETVATLADVDHRAVACAKRNADALGLADRSRISWWDAVSEPAPGPACDLVLVNPPFHSGVPVDLQPARAIFRSLGRVLAPGGRALIVANRTLPWERDLRALGTLRQVEDHAGYKILDLRR